MRHSVRLYLVNVITILRVPLVVLFGAAALAGEFLRGIAWLPALALALLLLAALSDACDGYLARRWQVVTRFGALMDPIADRVFYLMSLPVLLCLVARQGDGAHTVLLLLLTVLFMMRDQWVAFLSSVATEFGSGVKVNWAGKVRTALGFVVACLIYVRLAWQPVWLPRPVLVVLELLGIFVNLYSMASYTRQYLPSLRRALGL